MNKYCCLRKPNWLIVPSRFRLTITRLDASIIITSLSKYRGICSGSNDWLIIISQITCFLTYGSYKWHKYFRDPRNKKDRVLPKKHSNNNELKHSTIKSFLAHVLQKKKKDDIFTLAIDEFLQMAESTETACCSINEPSQSPSPFHHQQHPQKLSQTQNFRMFSCTRY